MDASRSRPLEDLVHWNGELSELIGMPVTAHLHRPPMPKQPNVARQVQGVSSKGPRTR